MPKSLADGHQKLIICTTAPGTPSAPTVTELAAGIDASCAILASDFVFGATASDTVQERALCQTTNPTAFGASNWQVSMTLFRYFLTTVGTTFGQIATAEDTAYTAVKLKGTELWLYLRENGKLASTAVTAGDDLSYAHVITDNPQRPSSADGYIKRTIPLAVQDGLLDVLAVAGA